MEALGPETGEQGGTVPVFMRTPDDCMTCCLAMFTGRSYDRVRDAALAANPGFPSGGPMTHSMMRCLASRWGFTLLSGIHMVWLHPAIIGVVSPTTPGCGHAVFWDGGRLIDPNAAHPVDLDYVREHAMEFTQRAVDLEALVLHDRAHAPASRVVSLREHW